MPTLDFFFHEKQLEIYNDPHRFKIVCCGRRFGKTRMCSYVVIIRALSKPEQIVWIVSPKYSQTMIMWRMIKKYLPRSYVKDIKEGELVIELVNGSTIWAKSADNPDALVGEGLDLLIMDEAARVKPDAWEVALQPALADKKGDAIFISTPKGKNWFYQLYNMGKNETFPEYQSFNYPSVANTTIPDFESEIARRKETTPELIFRQEYLAEFIEGGGEVFQDIRGVLEECLREPIPMHSYVMGVDLAKHRDFTVLTVADVATSKIVHFERFSRVDWNYQKDRIVYVAKLYNDAVAYIDSTGVGDPIVEDLQRMDILVSPYKFTIQSKYDLVKNLNIMIRSKKIGIPSVQVVIDELSSYTFDISDLSGVIRYGAPEGMHDDCVTSVMLTAWGLSKNRTEVVGELSIEEISEEYDISKYGLDDDERYIDWDDGFETDIGAIIRSKHR